MSLCDQGPGRLRIVQEQSSTDSAHFGLTTITNHSNTRSGTIQRRKTPAIAVSQHRYAIVSSIRCAVPRIGNDLQANRFYATRPKGMYNSAQAGSKMGQLLKSPETPSATITYAEKNCAMPSVQNK